MEEQDAKHYLKILVECELFFTLRLLTEGNFSKSELSKKQQVEIIKFINGLNSEYKNISDRDEIIATTLNKMGMKTVWGKKKIEEIAMTQKRNTTIVKESDDKDIEIK